MLSRRIMMSTEETKFCKMCYKEISSKAKKCPYCQHWQNKWSMITFHPLFTMIPGMIVFIVIFALLGKMFQTTFSEGEPFSQYTALLSIIETQMVFGVNECEHKSATVAILGKIRNESTIAWKDIKLEAIFFDKEGKMIDTTQRETTSTVPTNGESAFKISFRREFPQENYNSFKIRIISAKDERKRF